MVVNEHDVVLKVVGERRGHRRTVGRVLRCTSRSHSSITTLRDKSIILPDSAQLEGPQPGSSMANSGAKTDLREQEAVYDIMRATGNGWATDIPDEKVPKAKFPHLCQRLFDQTDCKSRDVHE
ncbi:protein TOO MANY MOUTHS [Forsythia ovata]|uniref:Protein TOO MANY MOUTHS n=1 Tax=Forsythia ovata TaxID=205694 RepID=A0ABD1TM66_9LAMI